MKLAESILDEITQIEIQEISEMFLKHYNHFIYVQEDRQSQISSHIFNQYLLILE